MKTQVLLAAFLGMIGACHATPARTAPGISFPAGWSAASGAGTASEPPVRWWQGFADAELDSLVERAVAANLDLALARARILEARALRDVAAGARLPELDARAAYTRSQLSGNTRQGSITGAQPRNLFDVGFDARWEIDHFGTNRNAVMAAEAGLAAAEEGRRDALVSLLGEIAREYVELRGSQQEIALTRANAEAQRQTLALTRARFQAGLATDLDVARAQALVSGTEAQVPSFQVQVSSGVHRLSVLLGEAPGRLESELGEEKPLPRAGPALEGLAAGVPSDLLRRRPDIRRAERELAGAAALTAQATADLYPKLSLGASAGLQSAHSGDLLESGSKTWSIGPSLLATIFDGDRLRAMVRVQNARQEQALVRYRQTVLSAMEEVENALSAVARERERRKSLEEALAASRRALELANDLHLRGLVDFFEVLDAQRSQLLAETELARSETALSSQTVSLYKALGGGWEDRPEAPPAEAPAPRSGT